MASTAPTAKVSMILTPPAWLTGSRPDSDPRQPPQLQQKRPHNGHCVTLELRPGYNMSHRMGRRGLWHGHCRYNQQRGPKPVPTGEVRTPGIQKESMGSEQLDAKPDTRPSNNKNETLLHTQASDRTPGLKTRAVFFAFGEAARSRGPKSETPLVAGDMFDR
jgi:hypothetical protein